MSLQDTINQAQAKIQGEVGRFLILKESIMSLPSGPRRDGLLSIQNDLEGRAMKMVAEATALKDSMNYRGLDMFKAISMQNINNVANLTKNAAQLVKEMAVHKANVASTANSSASGSVGVQSLRDSLMASQLNKAVVIAAAAYSVNWLWHKARSKARGKS